MTVRRATALVALLLAAACHREPEYPATGDVLVVDQARAVVVIRHEAIPDLMGAMTMRFPAESPAVLEGVRAGDRVRFTLRRRKNELVVASVIVTEHGKEPPAGVATPAPGVHDHTPHHGGVVGMAGELHLEALATPDGTVRVYLTDVWRRPHPLDGVTGAVTLELPDQDRELALARTEDALEAKGPALALPEVNAHVALRVADKPVEMDFLLPVSEAGTGAAGLPVRGCEAVPTRRTARTPRCTIQFAKPVTTLAVTPDAGVLLVAGVDLGVSAWQLPTGTLLRALAPPPPITVPGIEGLRPHPESANALAVRSGRREVAVALEGRLLRYAVDSGQLARELPGLQGVLRALAWSSDGRRLLVSAFYDATAHVLEAEDGREVGRLAVEREAAAVAFSPDGRLAAVGSELGPISLFDLATGETLRTLTGPMGATSALAFAGARLVSAGEDGVVRVWDPTSGALLGERRKTLAISRLAVAPGNRIVASGGLDGYVRLHDLDGDQTDDNLKWHGSQITGLAWAGTILVSADSSGSLALWDLGDVGNVAAAVLGR